MSSPNLNHHDPSIPPTLAETNARQLLDDLGQPNSLSTIKDLYLITLARAEIFTAMREDRSRTDLIRGHFTERALALEYQAGYLAHCCILFGNVKLIEIDFARLREEVSEKRCGGQNPWARGLSVIEAAIRNFVGANQLLSSGFNTDKGNFNAN